ncbi:unnamed protein product [Effrenium voratum]|nr:unnamed protein product [Effrenium voratum]
MAAFAQATRGNPLCWSGWFSYERCCSHEGLGNPSCWTPDFTYDLCCQPTRYMSGTSETCANRYEGFLRNYGDHSGGQSTIIRDGHLPGELLQKHAEEIDLDITRGYQGQGTGEFWFELFRAASLKQIACWQLGGRSWEAEFETSSWEATLKICRTGLTALPQNFRVSMCAPKQCELEDICGIVLPRYFQWDICPETYFPPLPVSQVQLYELSSWSSLHLDFGIIGMNTCGTTSLQRNLALHPEISFTSEGEDDFFVPGGYPMRFSGSIRVLPRAKSASSANEAWSMRRKELLGVNNPNLFYTQEGLQAIARIPKIRLVLILCDPVSRAEKLHYLHCRRSGWGTSRCQEELAKAVSGKLPYSWRVYDHLLDLSRLIRLQSLTVFVIHQEFLRDHEFEVYDSIANYLGVKAPFPDSTQFGRYNSIRGGTHKA